jgi:membrane associated rhomboid family serine protease
MVFEPMEPPLRPWESEEVFPPKPEGQPYGTYSGRKAKPCGRDDLIALCSADQMSPVHLVWTPDTPRMVPPAEVDFLQAAVRERARKRHRTHLILGLLNTFLGAFFTAGAWSATRSWDLLGIVLLNVFLLGVLPVIRNARALRALKTWTPETLKQNSAAVRYTTWLQTRRITFTWAIAALILAVGALQMLKGLSPSIAAAGLVKDAVRRGEVWRLMSCGLLHGNILHFIFNMSALLSLGRLTEVVAHRSHLALVFLAAVFGGSVSSLVLSPHTTSVGASGGLMGLFGFLAILGLRRHQALPPAFGRSMMVGIAWVAGIGILGFRWIDNAAHLGGLIAGVLLGLALIPKQGDRLPTDPGRALRRVGVGSLVALGLVTGLTLWKLGLPTP